MVNTKITNKLIVSSHSHSNCEQTLTVKIFRCQLGLGVCADVPHVTAVRMVTRERLRVVLAGGAHDKSRDGDVRHNADRPSDAVSQPILQLYH